MGNVGKIENDERILTPSVFSDYSVLIKDVFIDRDRMSRIIGCFDNDIAKYDIESEKEESGHRYGDGGEVEEKIVLKKDGRCVMVSRQFCAYHSYLDDSEDFVVQNIRDTYIFGHDNIIKRIFPEIF